MRPPDKVLPVGKLDVGLGRALAEQLDMTIREHRMAGIVAGVAHGDHRGVAAAGFGNTATRSPLTSATAVRIASVTKPIVAAATVLACRELSMSLDTGIVEVLPGLTKLSPALTIRQVLGQVSGLQGEVPARKTLVALGNGDDVTMAAAELVANVGQVVPPGSSWSYYNGNYYLAGAVLCQLRGSTFEQALAELVLAPAGMRETGFETPRHASNGHDSDGTPVETAYPRARRPGGGLWSTASDLLRFGDFVLSGSELLATMRYPVTPPEAEHPYGLGWFVLDDVILHTGDLPGFKSILLLAPAQEYRLCIVVNDDRGEPAMLELTNALCSRAIGKSLPM